MAKPTRGWGGKKYNAGYARVLSLRCKNHFVKVEEVIMIASEKREMVENAVEKMARIRRTR